MTGRICKNTSKYAYTRR